MSSSPDQTIIDAFQNLHIKYELIQHDPFFTCAESGSFWKQRAKQNPEKTTSNAKSLLVRNKKKTEYFLVLLDCELKIDMKALAQKLDTTRLSFASPNDLEQLMKVYPGCVNPFSLIHDKSQKIKLFIQKEILDFSHQAYHPGDNKFSVELTTTDFLKYLKNNSITHHILEL